jgi:hypothetical protein
MIVSAMAILLTTLQKPEQVCVPTRILVIVDKNFETGDKKAGGVYTVYEFGWTYCNSLHI